MPEDLGRAPHLGQHPRVHDAGVQEGPGDPHGQDHRRQGGDADGRVLGQHEYRRLPSGMGRARLHQDEGDGCPTSSGGGGFLLLRRRRHLDPGAPEDARQSTTAGRSTPRRWTGARSTSAASPSSSRPAPHNVLGVVKFLFPNKHDIYMHDTPQRELFEQAGAHCSATAASACTIPGGWPSCCSPRTRAGRPSRCAACWRRATTTRSSSTREIPVHVTYFTAVAGEDGQVSYYGDIYGHDSRMAAALGGRPLPPEAAARRRAAARGARARQAPQQRTDRLLLRPVRQLAFCRQHRYRVSSSGLPALARVCEGPQGPSFDKRPSLGWSDGRDTRIESECRQARS